MKHLIVILTRFLRAADTSWMIAASMFVFCNCKNLITTNLHRFYCNISFPDKPQGRQVFWRGKGIWRLDKSQAIIAYLQPIGKHPVSCRYFWDEWLGVKKEKSGGFHCIEVTYAEIHCEYVGYDQ